MRISICSNITNLNLSFKINLNLSFKIKMFHLFTACDFLNCELIIKIQNVSGAGKGLEDCEWQKRGRSGNREKEFKLKEIHFSHMERDLDEWTRNGELAALGSLLLCQICDEPFQGNALWSGCHIENPAKTGLVQLFFSVA